MYPNPYGELELGQGKEKLHPSLASRVSQLPCQLDSRPVWPAGGTGRRERGGRVQGTSPVRGLSSAQVAFFPRSNVSSRVPDPNRCAQLSYDFVTLQMARRSVRLSDNVRGI